MTAHQRRPGQRLAELCLRRLGCETRLAMTACGLDPGVALGLHVDQRARASGSLDLMEAARPVADALVLSMFEDRVCADLTSWSCRAVP
jgi:CRISPR associated protein Cas1